MLPAPPSVTCQLWRCIGDDTATHSFPVVGLGQQSLPNGTVAVAMLFDCRLRVLLSSSIASPCIESIVSHQVIHLVICRQQKKPDRGTVADPAVALKVRARVCVCVWDLPCSALRHPSVNGLVIHLCAIGGTRHPRALLVSVSSLPSLLSEEERLLPLNFSSSSSTPPTLLSLPSLPSSLPHFIHLSSSASTSTS